MKDISRNPKTVFTGSAIILAATASTFAQQKIYMQGGTAQPPLLPSPAVTEAPAPVYGLMLILGIGSGAAMIPYSIIKEVNPDQVKGSATGVMNFLTFSVTAVVSPIFARLLGGSLASNPDHAVHFREAAWFWATIVALSMGVALALRETGSAVHAPAEAKTS